MKKKTSKRAPRRRQYRRKAPMYRRMRGGHVLEKAGASYSTNSAPLFPNASVYSFMNFALTGASTRVQSIASAYQFYRIKKVTWEVRPAYDTFQAAATGSPTSVPQLYWQIDRDAVFTPSTTLQTLKAAGCKPIRLDDKIIRKSFRPAVLQGVASQPGAEATAPVLVLGSKRISPWLPTNANAYVDATQNEPWAASSIDHLGLLLAVDQDAGVNTSIPVAYVSFTVEFEFKKPLDTKALGQDVTVTNVPLETLAPQYVPPSEGLKVTM